MSTVEVQPTWAQSGSYPLNEDRLGQFFAQRDADIANLANHAVLAAEKLDALVFPETHFAQAAADVSAGQQFADANRRAGVHPV